MKEEILACLEWAENIRATSLWSCDGYDDPWPENGARLVDEYIEYLEEMND